ncbi:MAG: GNAT family N-acetyltransferase [Proteobacteria bacterium]|nr:GNAT family N-acetyltransferase [Pseudomonadota bacterium]MDA1063285.1 GNAT family N-acetyltransferase [Pseudomonadota bacterium]
MPFQIHNVTPHDLPAILATNASEVPHVGEIDIDRLRWFAAHASYFRVARDGDQLAGFLVGLRPGSSYGSMNYRWFCDRYAEFAYVDRIVVAAHARRRGLAALLYDDFAAAMPASVRLMTCEVNIRPPNEQSMRFHTNLGFCEVGTLTSDAGRKEVALLLKQL